MSRGIINIIRQVCLLPVLIPRTDEIYLLLLSGVVPPSEGTLINDHIWYSTSSIYWQGLGGEEFTLKCWKCYITVVEIQTNKMEELQS